MTNTKRSRILATVAASVLGAGLLTVSIGAHADELPPAPAAAPARNPLFNGCTAGYICTYDTRDNRSLWVSDHWPQMGGWNDATTAISNQTTTPVCLHSDEFGGGATVRVEPYAEFILGPDMFGQVSSTTPC